MWGYPPWFGIATLYNVKKGTNIQSAFIIWLPILLVNLESVLSGFCNCSDFKIIKACSGRIYDFHKHTIGSSFKFLTDI